MNTRWLGVLAVVSTLSAPPVAHAVDLERSMTVQGVMTTSGGTPANGTYTVDVRLFTAASGGSAVWTTTVANVAVSGGVFEMTVGPVPAGVLEGAGVLWLEATVEGTTLPRQPLRAVPYALVAQRANDLACSG